MMSADSPHRLASDGSTAAYMTQTPSAINQNSQTGAPRQAVPMQPHPSGPHPYAPGFRPSYRPMPQQSAPTMEPQQRPGMVGTGPGQPGYRPPAGNLSSAPIIQPAFSGRPPAVDTISAPMANLQLNQPANVPIQQKPGRSKRVYAPVNDVLPPNTGIQRPMAPPGQVPRPHPVGAGSHSQQPAVGAGFAPAPMSPMAPNTMAPGYQPTPATNQPRPKPRIDPEQIPAPVKVQMQDEELYSQQEYGTCATTVPPLATTSFRSIDQGNSDPRFIRSTLREVPKNSDLLRDSCLPFGLVVQPLASLHPHQGPVPFADSTGSEGPVRCNRCKGYINIWCQFIDGGRSFICNLCGFSNTVSSDYFCHLDMAGRRVDANQRPELQYGTVEFEVPEIYWTRKPMPLHTLFAVDVSQHSVQNGVLESFCKSFQSMLSSEAFPKGTKVGIATFDASFHFYNLSPLLKQAQMMVVPDVNDMFLPLAESAIFVDPYESRNVITDLLTNLPTMFGQTTIQTAVFGSALKGALLALKSTGGKLNIFQTILPTAGQGTLKERDNPKLYGTDKERQLFTPQEPFYHALGKEYVNEGVSVNLWLFPTSYVDISTMGVVSSLTGGDTYYYPVYNKEKQMASFSKQLLHSVTREQGYNAALRIRCSNGLSVQDQFGNFDMNNSTDIELAGIDCDKAFAFQLKHDGNLEGEEAYVQCALLYTSQSGRRIVRLHNIRMPVTSSINVVFRQGDLEPAINLIAKKAVSETAKKSLDQIGSELDRNCTRILASYRKNCASSASPGQLILPDAFKLLLLLTLCFKKTDILRKDGTINSDKRVFAMRKVKSIGTGDFIRWLYPRMIPLHRYLTQEADFPVPMERLYCAKLEAGGIYWLESPDTVFLWISQDVSADLLQAIFNVQYLHLVDPTMTLLPSLDGPASHRLQNLIHQQQTPIQIVRQGLDPDVNFLKALVEDDTFGLPSYVDYLCNIHKNVQQEIERDKYESMASSASYWAYRY